MLKIVFIDFIQHEVSIDLSNDLVSQKLLEFAWNYNEHFTEAYMRHSGTMC